MTFNIIIVAALIVLGVILLLVEFFLLPGISIAGIGGAIFMIGGVIYAYIYLGSGAGTATLVISLILLAALVAISYYPASALTITGEPAGDQIHWEIADGQPPYTVFVNGKEIVSGYPGTVVSTDSEPGRQYTAVVMDNESVADATVTGEYYTYPLWVWMLFAALVACLLISIWLPYAAFGAAIAGGFLLLMVAPNPDYAAYLRIFAGAAFIVGLAGLAGRMQG